MIVGVMSEIEAGSHKAHAINVVKTAGGFARLGHRVILWCRGKPLEGDPYGEPSVEWRIAPPELDAGKPGHPDARSRRFAEWATDDAIGQGVRFVYGRSFTGPLEAARAGLAAVCETHAGIGDVNPLLDQALHNARPGGIASIITISRHLAQHYISRGAMPDRVAVVPDGVDVELFSPPSHPALRGPDPFGVTDGRSRVLHSGHLTASRGIPTLIEAAPYLLSARVHLLGGLPEDVTRARDHASRVEAKEGAPAGSLITFHDSVPHAHVPRWLWHADCLVIPNSGKDRVALWASPVKLGEYLAAGRPIVASAVPALRELVDDACVQWFTPDDPADLARAIDRALGEAGDGQRQARRRELAHRYSYANRARAILLAAGLDEHGGELTRASVA